MKTSQKKGTSKKHLGTEDLILIGILSALWIVLHLTIGPLGFALFGLPVFCDVAAYFTLLLALWIFAKFGGASLVGIIGSIVILFLRPGAFQILGFAASAVLFDVLCLAIRHRAFTRISNILVLSVITIVSAYFAGAVIGSVFMTTLPHWSLVWTLTYWAGLHVAGGVISLLIALPVIGALERANVHRLIYRG